MKKTNVKLKLRTSQRMPKCGVLMLQVTRNRATRTMTTSYVLSSEEWDENEQSIVILANTTPQRKKELISIKNKVKKDLKELHTTVKLMEVRSDYSSQELLTCFRNRQQGQMFCAYILKKAEKLQQEERFGTAHTYQFAAVSFTKFLGGKDICIKKINADLMKDYERYLLSENKSWNTISCYMRSLRAVYNLALREKILVVKKTEESPFSRVFTGNAKTEKRAISGESIVKLISLNEVTDSNRESNEATGSNGTAIHSLAFSRDLFMFSLSTQGMSFTDMANLKKENIGEKFIRYKRKKTGQSITIEMEDCIREIIERYADSNSDFIFPILRNLKNSKASKVSEGYEKWKKTANALTAYNKNLKKLAGLAGISEHLTSYVARHSWATMASQEGIPMATISRGMGHESEKTTRIYISQIDYSDVGRANRQILSRIFAPTLLNPHTPNPLKGTLVCERP